MRMLYAPHKSAPPDPTGVGAPMLAQYSEFNVVWQASKHRKRASGARAGNWGSVAKVVAQHGPPLSPSGPHWAGARGALAANAKSEANANRRMDRESTRTS